MNTLTRISLIIACLQHAWSFPSFNKAGTATPPKNSRHWFKVKNEASAAAAVITIYEQIGYDYWDGSGMNAKAFSEQLKAIPADREIIVRINSPGGNVWDGLAIYNLLAARRNKVVVIVDGIALSIASVIALAGRELHMPRTALFMIHDPWTDTVGNAEEHRKIAEVLEVHKAAIVAAYRKKTGKSDEELNAAMSATSWFTGEEAKEFGFVDVVLDVEPIQNSADLSGFRRVPSALSTSTDKNSAAPGGEAKNKQANIMNRAAILALLQKRGIQFDNNATDEQLLALLDGALAKGQNTPPPAAAPAPAVAPVPAPTAAAAPSAEATRLTQIENQLAAERTNRITRQIDNAILDRRIVASQRDNWIKRAVSDETILTDILAMPQIAPPADSGVHVLVASDSPADLCSAIQALRQPSAKLMRGESITNRDLNAASMQIAQIVAANGDKLRSVMNANTIDSNLKRTVILQSELIQFERLVLALNAFSTSLQSVPLQGTNKIAVPYYPRFTTPSAAFVQADGYVFPNSTNTSSKEVTINKRQYLGLKVTSEEMARQPYLNSARLLGQQLEQLGIDVVEDVLSLVTEANFGDAIKDVPYEAFDTVDIVDCRVAVDRLFWPKAGRSMLLDSSFHGNIEKSLLDVSKAGTDQTMREGVIGRYSGFEIFGSPSIPANGEDLAGFVNLPSAILVGTAPVIPSEAVMRQLVRYEVFTSPKSGVTFEYRHWGVAQADSSFEVIESNYGFDLGELEALKRITGTR